MGAELELQGQAVRDDEDECRAARLLRHDGDGGRGEERRGGGERERDNGHEEEGLHRLRHVLVEELLLAARAAGAEGDARIEQVGSEDVADEGGLEGLDLVAG